MLIVLTFFDAADCTAKRCGTPGDLFAPPDLLGKCIIFCVASCGGQSHLGGCGFPPPELFGHIKLQGIARLFEVESFCHITLHR